MKPYLHFASYLVCWERVCGHDPSPFLLFSPLSAIHPECQERASNCEVCGGCWRLSCSRQRCCRPPAPSRPLSWPGAAIHGRQPSCGTSSPKSWTPLCPCTSWPTRPAGRWRTRAAGSFATSTPPPLRLHLRPRSAWTRRSGCGCCPPGWGAPSRRRTWGAHGSSRRRPTCRRRGTRTLTARTGREARCRSSAASRCSARAQTARSPRRSSSASGTPRRRRP